MNTNHEQPVYSFEVSMKKSFFTLLTVLACSAAQALPVGNPSDASLLCDGLIWEGHCGDPNDPCLTWCDAFSLRVGFYGDYVFNRHLRLDTNEFNKSIEHARLSTNAGFIAANFWDRFDLFTSLGATRLCLESNSFAFGGPSGSRTTVESSTDFSWSLGLRGTIWECGCTSLGAEAQYFSTCPHINRVTFAELISVYPSNVDAKYREWQVGVGISHRINIFVPYIAVKWSRAKVDYDNATFGIATLLDQRSKKDWGYAVGVSLVDCEKASLTVEGRFADETALYVNGQLRF
jgi:major outer membrane protein